MARWDELDLFQQWSVRFAVLGQVEASQPNEDPREAHKKIDEAAARVVNGPYGEQLIEEFEEWTREILARDERGIDLFIPPDRQLVTDLRRFDDARMRLIREEEDLRRLSPREFEELVAELWSGFGYDVELTKQTRDGGKDIIAISRHLVHVKFLVECKAPRKAEYIGPEPVRALMGVTEIERATKGILATTVRFSADAKAIFERSIWQLEGADCDDVLEWIRRYARNRR